MPLFRRRDAGPAAAGLVHAFTVSASFVDRAQRALLRAIPTSRDPGTDLDDALDDFERWTEKASESVGAWRTAETADIAQRCERGLEAARAAAAGLRAQPRPVAFEPLNALVGEVLDPLEEFVDAERALRERAAGRR